MKKNPMIIATDREKGFDKHLFMIKLSEKIRDGGGMDLSLIKTIYKKDNPKATLQLSSCKSERLNVSQ
jgi:hypothetical protein